jgi:hypothetical protein
MHLQLQQWWRDLEQTHKLTPAVQHAVDGKIYLRMECCNMPPFNWLDEQVKEIKYNYAGNNKQYLVEGDPPHNESIPPHDDGTFRTFHNTEMSNLLSIFRDGYLRFGDWHGDGVGVYMYGYNSARWLSPDDAMLELRVPPLLTKLATGSKSRYVLKAPIQGPDAPDTSQLCKGVEVVAVWLSHGFCPQVLQHSARVDIEQSLRQGQDFALEKPWPTFDIASGFGQPVASIGATYANAQEPQFAS